MQKYIWAQVFHIRDYETVLTLKNIFESAYKQGKGEKETDKQAR